MLYRVIIYPSNIRVLKKNPYGMSNQYFLVPEVDEWLAQYDDKWHIENIGYILSWHRDPLDGMVRIWLPYEGPTDNTRFYHGPAVFVFEDANVAILFKLTWG